ncbi:MULTISPECIES: sodium/proline symporter [Hyphobacterium]|uniref:Sodium/proline symporter n=1 Tax=Hyphobacterium vulgare TaxID=1736751 RepID=A0ABV6ZW87_9PROT
MDNWIILGTLAAYKLMLLGVGLWAANRNRSESDFFLGGRGLGPWVAGLSYAASTSSAWVLLGFSGFVYAAGISALWMVPGILAGYVVVWVWLGPRIRAETEARGHVTMTDYMAAGTGGIMRKAIALWSALLVLFCFIFYIAAQFGAAAIAFESQFGLGHFESVAIGAAVILIYSLMGGFWAVSVTDTIQGALMALIAVALPLTALIAAGGPAGVFETLAAREPSAYLSWTGERGVFLFLGFAMGIAAIGLGTFGQPHLIARLMAVKDDAARKRGFVIAISWAVIVYAGMSTLALSGRALLGAGQEGEALFYTLAAQLFPTVLAGLIIAAVLSAVMSTVDSLLIATSAAVAHDMGVAKAMPGREVLISRIVMTVLCVLAVILAMTLPATIFDRVLFSWSALGAAFGPILFARVAGREPAGAAILLAITAGFFTTVFFYAWGQIGGDSWPAQLAALPGDPFERVAPWIVPLILVFAWRQSRRTGSSPLS